MKNSVQIQYWSGIYTDRSLKEVLKPVHKAALAQCFSSSKRVRFHKLKGHPNIFAIGYNDNGRDEGRLILTIKDGKLIVLADLPNHGYKPKLKSLKPLLKLFNSNKVELKTDSQSDDDSGEDPTDDFERMEIAPDYDRAIANNNNDDDDGDDPEIDYQPVVFEGDGNANVLVLDEDQQKVIEIEMPAIVSGPPGSGKTTVARALLTQVGRLGQGEKILYLARSSDLVNQIKQEINHIATNEMKEKINIRTYNDFITDENNNNAKSVLRTNVVEEETKGLHPTRFTKDWLQNYIRDTKIKNKLSASFKGDIDNVIQEFRIRSGIDEKSYCDTSIVGAKQSLYKTTELRAWVNDAYKAFIVDLSKQDFLIADFTEIPPTTPKYHTVIVDEAQDLSNLQLASIKNNLAKSNRLCFFYGDGQSLEDDLPSKIYIKSLFAAPLTVQTASLTQHYRCSDQVMFIAGVVNDLRIKLTPKNKKEEPLKIRNHKQGGVKWIGKEQSPDELRALRDLIATNKAEVCIIAHHDKLKDAQQLFNAKPWQVRTPERVKGLQYQTVIIYEPFADGKFKTIDTAMEQENVEDSSFSSPLSQLFVSITRAEQDVILYSSIHRKNLESRLKKAITDTQSTVEMAAQVSSVTSLEQRAVSLMRNREWENGLAILKDELGYDEQMINDFAHVHHVVLPATDPESSKSTVVKSKAQTNKKKAKQRSKTAQVTNVKQRSAAQPVKKVKSHANTNNALDFSKLKAMGFDLSIKDLTGEYKGCTYLFSHSRQNKRDVVITLCEQGAIVDEFQEEGSFKGVTALYIAAAEGHDKIIDTLFKYGAKIDLEQSEGLCKGLTALYAAVVDNRINAVNKLIELGVELDHLQGVGTRNAGVSVLYAAASKGYVKIATALINAGADVNQLQEEQFKGSCALDVALTKMDFSSLHREIALLLLKAGASLGMLPQIKQSDGTYRLNYPERTIAFLNRFSECEAKAVQLLRDELESSYPELLDGINNEVNAIKNSQFVSLYKLLFKARWELFNHVSNDDVKRILIDELPQVYKDFKMHRTENEESFTSYKGCTHLFQAIKTGNVTLVERVLQSGVEVDELQGEGDFCGQTALFAAVLSDNEETVKRLVHFGAQLDKLPGRTLTGLTIQYDTSLYSSDMISLFRRVELCDKLAIEMINKELTKQVGAKTEMTGILQNAFIDLCNTLRWQIYINKREDLAVIAQEGVHNVRMRFCRKQAGIIVDSLLAQNPELKEPLKTRPEALKTVLERVSDAIFTNIDQSKVIAIAKQCLKDIVRPNPTALIEASRAGNLAEVQRLIKASISVDVVDNGNALSEASAGGFPEIVETLLEAGAEVNGSIGSYALLRAVTSFVKLTEEFENTNHFHEVILTLLRGGASTQYLNVDDIVEPGIVAVLRNVDNAQQRAKDCLEKHTAMIPKSILTRLESSGQMAKLNYHVTALFFQKMNIADIKMEISRCIDIIAKDDVRDENSARALIFDFKRQNKTRTATSASTVTIPSSAASLKRRNK